MFNRIALTTLFTGFLVLVLSGGCNPSSEPAPADFNITVEAVDGGLRLACAEGCAWTELSWDAPRYVPVSINREGMVSTETTGNP